MQAVEQQIKDQIDASQQLVAILESIKDKASMEAAWPRIEAHEKKAREIARRGAELGRPSGDVLVSLNSYVAELQSILDRQRAEIHRIRQLPEGSQFLEKLEMLRTSQWVESLKTGE